MTNIGADHDYKKFPELTNKQLALYGWSSPHFQIVSDFWATVVKVIDGDTVSVEMPRRDFAFPIRLLETDAKELGEGGEDAKQWLKDKLEQKTVLVLIDPKNRVGKYGRLLGRILNNGLSVSEEMLHLGLAIPFGTKNLHELPNMSKELNIKKWIPT